MGVSVPSKSPRVVFGRMAAAGFLWPGFFCASCSQPLTVSVHEAGRWSWLGFLPGGFTGLRDRPAKQREFAIRWVFLTSKAFEEAVQWALGVLLERSCTNAVGHARGLRREGGGTPDSRHCSLQFPWGSGC